ncbi:MAG: hypothetical protein L6Q38_08220 [Nitrospira sp.]|nr:hypothetical protein [Nitrospira sp.]
MASSPLDGYPSRSDVAANPLLLDQLLAPAIALLDGYIRSVRTEGAISDPDFVRLGILRVLSQAVSGRDFLQQCAETFGEPLERSTFFDTLHSARRQALVSELNALLVARTDVRRGDPREDLLSAFAELRDRAVYAVDGHQLEHACHAARDRKGSYVPGNTLYLLCLHSALLVNLGAVQGDGQYGHELPVFRRRLVDWLQRRGKTKGSARPIFVGDPAFVDKQFWLQMRRWEQRGALIITRTKANMDPIVYSNLPWDPHASVNQGIQAHELVGFDGGGSMRRIRYIDPETGTSYEFLTSVPDLEPGLIALLYLLRWRIEKVFDTGKNKLQETKDWATGVVAREIRAHFFALTHNLLTLLRRELDRRHGIRELKIERKRQNSMERRVKSARKLNRSVHPIQWKLPAIVQLTAQFIRTLRNGIWSKARWLKVLPQFQASLSAYL